MNKIAIILGVVLAAAPAFANGGWWDDVYDQKTVPLETILANPVAFRGMDVAFVVQFHQLGSIENPYYTPFEKESYINFSVWSDGAALWDKGAYEKDFPYLFIDRMESESKTMLQARMYDRFIITGRVESIFRGKPWIEVVGLKALEEKLDEPSLIRMVKAYRLKKLRRYDAAASEFSSANSTTLPPHIAAIIDREQGLCLASANRYGEALVPLEKAAARRKNDNELERVLAF
ncbi:MAG: hypothetical protein KDB53_05405, partial [Planctomycetes bacterium]|nr:hypothetical protein [Planctomycetota bacterium]